MQDIIDFKDKKLRKDLKEKLNRTFPIDEYPEIAFTDRDEVLDKLVNYTKGNKDGIKFFLYEIELTLSNTGISQPHGLDGVTRKKHPIMELFDDLLQKIDEIMREGKNFSEPEQNLGECRVFNFPNRKK